MNAPMNVRWDDCCPHCQAQIVDLSSLSFYERARLGLQTHSDIQCPHCRRQIAVRVETFTEFHLVKPEASRP